MRAIFLFASLSLYALPQNPMMISGDVNFVQSGAQLEIFATNKSIINWEKFSILDGEKVAFSLPEVSHSILNRVVGGEVSSILGDMVCNGRMILINPSGLLFGPNAKIDTASLIVSSLDISNADFLKGAELHFISSSSQEIVNLGVIHVDGDLHLISPMITQNGSCISNQGEVILSSCNEAILNGPDGKIRLIPSVIKTLKEEGSQCGGTLKALQAHILSDGSLSHFAINLDGFIDAEGVQIQAHDGAVALNGTLFSNNLTVDSATVDIGPNAMIDLSSNFDGGKCTIYASEQLSMPPTALIDASSKVEGNGGEVILFSEGITHFQGLILAEGGSRKGDGGFVEVSGSNLFYQGRVSTKAFDGKTGTLLLDPVDIAITNGVTSNVTSMIALGIDTRTPNNGTPCYPGPGNAILNDTDLVNALMANNVVITTIGTVGACPGDIIFDQSVTYNSVNSLTLSAAGSITFNASVVNMGSGAISMTATAGDVNLIATTAPISVETTGGPIDITVVTGDLNIQGGTVMNTLARISAFNAALSVSVDGDINITGGSANGAGATLRNSVGNLDITNVNNIFVTGGSNSGADASIFSGSNGNATITCETMTVNTTASGAPVGVTGDGDLILNVTNGDLQVLADSGGFANVNGSFAATVTVSGNIILAGNGGGFATIFGDRESTTIQATNGSVTLNGATQIYSGNLPNQDLLVIAGTSIVANGTASFDIFSPTGTITLVVDNLFPSSPNLGSGQFVLGPTANVNANGNQLQIFTALPTQNSILGALNGQPFAPGANNERSGYYPDAFFVSDYVIFYKIPTIPSSLIDEVLVIDLQPEFDDFAEFFRILHPFSEYIYGAIRFSQSFEDPESLLGLTQQPEERFRLRKKSTSRDWFELVYDSAKF